MGMEIRRQNWEAAREAVHVIRKAYQEFEEIFHSGYVNPFFEELMTEDADTIIVGMGTVSAAARTAVRQMRKSGEKVGYIKLRWFRPFPSEDLRRTLSRVQNTGVIDRDFAHGGPDDAGVLFNEIRSAMYRLKNKPPMIDFVAGLAGREISIEDVIAMFRKTQKASEQQDGEIVNWVRVREREKQH